MAHLHYSSTTTMVKTTMSQSVLPPKITKALQTYQASLEAPAGPLCLLLDTASHLVICSLSSRPRASSTGRGELKMCTSIMVLSRLRFIYAQQFARLILFNDELLMMKMI